MKPLTRSFPSFPPRAESPFQAGQKGRLDRENEGRASAVAGRERARLQSALESAVRHGDIGDATRALERGADPEKVLLGRADDGMRDLLVYARRLNKLYPPDAASVGIETSLDDALRHGLNAEFRERVKDRVDRWRRGRRIEDMWCYATTRKKHDLLRAILLLNADNYPSFRVLQRDPVVDKRVAQVMKEIPYFSPKRGRPNNLNGRGNFANTDEAILCRHLVEYRQSVQECTAAHKFDYAHYESKEAIEARVPIESETRYARLLARAAETHLFFNRDFGRLLVRQLTKMEAEGEPDRLIVLDATRHAMGVDLTIKQEGGKLRYGVTLFDPNATTSHARAVSDSLSAFEALTLESFLGRAYGDYYREAEKVSVAFVRPKTQGEPARWDSGTSVAENRMLTSCIEDKNVDATLLWHLLARGFSGDVRRLRNEVASRPSDEVKELLAAKDAEGAPGLFVALQEGHAAAVEAFGELLALAPEDSRAGLVAAKDPNETPGLFMALQEGHAGAVKAFGEFMKHVPPESRAELVAAKDAHGSPGLFMALQNGRVDAIKAFGEIMKQVPPESHVDLAAAKDARETPGLFMALKKGNSGAIKAFGQMLALVPPESRAALIAAKSARKTPGAFMALQRGHAGAIEAFGQVLALVPEQLRGALLAAKRADQAPGLLMALQKGHHAAIQAFVETLKQVPEEARLALLAAKAANGTHGLHLAFGRGHADSIEAFGEGLKWVPPESRAELVAAKSADGAPGLFMALHEGHVGAVQAFGELLKRVPEKSRAELVAAKDADGTPGLFMALQAGHADAVEAFGQVLTLVPEESRAELVAAKDADGTPGFSMALQAGHVDAIKAFGQVLKQVPEESRAELFVAKDADEPPGLFMVALQNGHAGAIRAFGEVLKRVPERSRRAVLAAGWASRVPGPPAALQRGHGDAIDAYVEVMALLSPRQPGEPLEETGRSLGASTRSPASGACSSRAKGRTSRT